MGENLTRMELKQVRKFLSKVYPGVAEQDDLWNLIKKIDSILKGKTDARTAKPGGDRRSR